MTSKKKYSAPALHAVPIMAEQNLLSSSFVGIGGDTDHFDTQKKNEGFEWDEPSGYWEE